MVRLDKVAKRYGDGPMVLRDVSLDLPAGSFHFLTGPSGSGKSTLLRLIYLAERPTEGRLFLFDQEVRRVSRRNLPKLRRQIGLVFQDFRLLDHLSAFDNVALPLRIAGRPEREVQEYVGDLLRWVGLAEQVDAPPSTLSGGQQQRVAIARAVIAQPNLLLADEPTGNVDDDLARRILGLFDELHRLGTTVLFATHSEALIEQAPHPVLRIEDGRVQVARGGPASGVGV